jgi:hypothetical protein
MSFSQEGCPTASLSLLVVGILPGKIQGVEERLKKEAIYDILLPLFSLTA